MAYIEIKKIKGREYHYERISYRVGKQIKHKSRYLSPAGPLNNRILMPEGNQNLKPEN